MIYVVATLAIKPGSLEAFADIALPLIAMVRTQQGCRLYDMHASFTDPERLVFLEQWDSRAALDAHFASPHMASFNVAAQPYVDRIQVEVIHPDHVDVF